MKYKITRCKGEGQGECTRCAKNGKWNRNWMVFLYEIEGIQGIYCDKCIKEMGMMTEKNTTNNEY